MQGKPTTEKVRYNVPMKLSASAQLRTPPTRVRNLVSQIATKIRQQFGNQTQVIWFGSWVKGNAHPNSDIDLAISSIHAISSQEFAILRDWVDDLPTLFSIDLINLHEASPSLVDEIKTHGINVD